MITSQDATAPKHLLRGVKRLAGLITSQDATAPKPLGLGLAPPGGLITSQDATAPKPHEYWESVYMESGFSQRTAHEMANMKYNYQEALDKWLEAGAKV